MNRRSFFASIIGATLAAKLSINTRNVAGPMSVTVPCNPAPSIGDIWVAHCAPPNPHGILWFVRRGDQWEPLVTVNRGEESE